MSNEEEGGGNSSRGSLLRFSKRAIITFNEFALTRKILSSFKLTAKERLINKLRMFAPANARKKLDHYYFLDQFIKVRKAPEPTDILWTNIGTTNGKCKHVLLSYFAVYSLIFVSFLILLSLKRGINKLQVGEEQFISLALSFSSSAVVALFNTLLGTYSQPAGC